MRTTREGVMKRIATWSAILALELGAAALAQSPAPGDSDRAAVAAIVMGAVTEVQLCGLAIEKSQSPDVRSFCRNVATDHTRTAIAGMQLAQKLGAGEVKLQAAPGTPARIEALAQFSGHDFDRAFLLAQIEDHENDQDTIRYATEVATDSAVKRYEDGVLPKVEKFLHLAEGALNTISRDQP